MHTGVPTVVSRNICISQHGLSAYTNEMKLVLYIIHITVDALSITLPVFVENFIMLGPVFMDCSTF